MKILNKSQFNSFFLNETLRILFLFTVASYLSLPHLGSALISFSQDAQTYYFLITDFVLQIREGLFPTYINQGLLASHAIPILPRAPYMFLLAGFLDFITASKLSLGTIFNLTINFSIFSGIFVCYLILIKLNPLFRWQAAMLAAIYILSPGVGGLIYIWNMYFSSMTIPFVPIFFYSIIRSFTQRDYISSSFFGISLSLIWMAHPPIGIACILLALFAQCIHFIFYQRTIKFIKIISASYLIFLMLSAFYFISVFVIGANVTSQPYSVNMLFHLMDHEFMQALTRGLNWTLETTFNPIHLFSSYSIRLTIMLWILFIVSTILSIKNLYKNQKIFIILSLLITVLIFPVPFITQYIWSHLPNIFALISEQPNFRLCISLTVVIVFAVYFAYENIFNHKRKLLFVITLLCVIASARDIYYSMAEELYTYIHNNQTQIGNTKTLSLPENLRLFTMAHYMGEEDVYFIPFMENKIISKNGEILQSVKQILIQRCQLQNPTNFKNKFPTEETPGIPGPSYSLNPGKFYFLGFSLDAQKTDWTAWLRGEQFLRIYTITTGKLSTSDFNIIPLWNSENYTKKIATTFMGRCKPKDNNCDFSLNHICFQEFNPLDNDFPIRLISIAPYKAELKNIKKESFLETHRMFIKNYRVTVNGKQTPYYKSKNGRVLIPIHSGNSTIEISFLFTPLMLFSLVISVFGFLSIIFFGVYRKFKKGNLAYKF